MCASLGLATNGNGQLMRLRSSTIEAIHWSLAGDEHLGEGTDDSLLFYRLRNDISHLLAAGRDGAAVARLERFEALRTRFLLPPQEAYEVVSRDLEAVHEWVDEEHKKRIIPWLSFWRSSGAFVSSTSAHKFRSIQSPKCAVGIASRQSGQVIGRNTKFNTSSLPGHASDQTGALELQDGRMHCWWADFEVALHVRLGRSDAVDLGVRIDKREVLALLGRKSRC